MTAELKGRHTQFMMLLTSRSWSSVPRSPGGGHFHTRRSGVYSLATFKETFKDLNQKHFCLPTSKMLNKRCLKNLVVAKRQQARTGCLNYLMSGKQCRSISPGLKEQKHEFYHSVICLVTTFHSVYFKVTQP